MTTQFTITRRLEIDAGHRVPDHKSKCKNLHGHRYVIEATCKGDLADKGEQRGMVMDFGFLKEEMVNGIEKVFDHALILWTKDPVLAELTQSGKRISTEHIFHGVTKNEIAPFGMIVVVNVVPTAENLARLWFLILHPLILNRSAGRASLSHVTVHETPNCQATYPAP